MMKWKVWVEEDRRFLSLLHACGYVMPIGFLHRCYGGRMMESVWHEIDRLLTEALEKPTGILSLVQAVRLLAGEVRATVELPSPYPNSRQRGEHFLAAVRGMIQEANRSVEPDRIARLAASGILTMLDGSGVNPGMPIYRVYELAPDGTLQLVKFSHHDL